MMFTNPETQQSPAISMCAPDECCTCPQTGSISNLWLKSVELDARNCRFETSSSGNFGWFHESLQPVSELGSHSKSSDARFETFLFRGHSTIAAILATVAASAGRVQSVAVLWLSARPQSAMKPCDFHL